MKKIFTAVLLALALVLALGIAGCSQETGSGADDGKFSELTTAESVYGFSAASAGMIISSMNGGSAAQLASAKGVSVYASAQDGTAAAPADDTAAPPADGTAGTVPEGLDRYMALVESLLSDGGFSVVSQPSDDPEYSEKMTVSYKDLAGNTLQYTMYYNQELIASETDRDDDDDETEETFAIRGVMEIDGTFYAVEGSRENETEGNESESETKFRVTLSDASYMLVEQGYETEEGETEQEYSYSVYSGGALAERSTFSYEDEQGETELKMTSYKDGVRETLYFERETVRGEEVIRLRIGSGEGVQSYIVHITEGEDGKNRYEYEPVTGR